MRREKRQGVQRGCAGCPLRLTCGALSVCLPDWCVMVGRAVALVPALGSVLAVGPLVAMLVLSPHDLAASLAWLSLEYLLAEGWLGPALALLQVGATRQDNQQALPPLPHRLTTGPPCPVCP